MSVYVYRKFVNLALAIGGGGINKRKLNNDDEVIRIKYRRSASDDDHHVIMPPAVDVKIKVLKDDACGGDKKKKKMRLAYVVTESQDPSELARAWDDGLLAGLAPPGGVGKDMTPDQVWPAYGASIPRTTKYSADAHDHLLQKVHLVKAPPGLYRLTDKCRELSFPPVALLKETKKAKNPTKKKWSSPQTSSHYRPFSSYTKSLLDALDRPHDLDYVCSAPILSSETDHPVAKVLTPTKLDIAAKRRPVAFRAVARRAFAPGETIGIYNRQGFAYMECESDKYESEAWKAGYDCAMQVCVSKHKNGYKRVVFLDVSPVGNPLAMMNDARGGLVANCIFDEYLYYSADNSSSGGDNKDELVDLIVAVRAARPIAEGDELVVSYGAQYWAVWEELQGERAKLMAKLG
jgi:hypothetical protein